MASYKIIDGVMVEQPEEKPINNSNEMESKFAEMQEALNKKDAEIQRLSKQNEKLRKGQQQ